MRETREIVTAAQPAVHLQALLVEDSEDDEIIVRRLISSAGLDLQLSVARTGLEAIEELEERLRVAPQGETLPHFILLDLSLPSIRGIEVLRRIKGRAELCDIPVIILSGSEDESEIREGQDLRAHTHIIKPMSGAELSWIVKSVQNYWPKLQMLRQLEAT